MKSSPDKNNEYKLVNKLLPLKLTSGKMMIKTEPEGAKISLNGIYQGQSPMLIKNLDVLL